jgi:hypothetical protein
MLLIRNKHFFWLKMAKNKHLGKERFLYSNWFFTDLGGNKCLVIFEQILKISIIVSSHHFWSDHSECILGYNLDQLVSILMKLSNHQIPCFKKIVYQGILRVLTWKWIQKASSVEVRCFILEQLNLKKSNVSWTKKIRQICLQPPQVMFNKLIF